MNTPSHGWGVIYALEKLGALSPEWTEKVRQLDAKGGIGGQTFEQFQTAQRGPKGPDPFAAMRPRQQAVARILGKYPMTGGWGDRYLEGLSKPLQKRVRMGFDVPHRELVIDSKQKAHRLHDTMFRELGSTSPKPVYPKYTEQMFYQQEADRVQRAFEAQHAHQAPALDRPGKPGTPVKMRQDPFGAPATSGTGPGTQATRARLPSAVRNVVLADTALAEDALTKQLQKGTRGARAARGTGLGALSLLRGLARAKGI